MDTLVISTLILQILGVIVTVLALALSSCLPARRAPRNWASTDSAARPADLQEKVSELISDVELPRAA